ncbi:MAG TPA: hypothetical protein VMW47_08560 [Verrucomicrobiae bacterium]|nr:hypothetical protein [Verrucomicrobiae bacterium]
MRRGGGAWPRLNLLARSGGFVGLGLTGAAAALTLAACGLAHPLPTSGAPASAIAATRSPRVAVIRTARVSVYGVPETVFTDGAGRTLYWFADDGPHQIACTVGCRLAWGPVLTRGDRIAIPGGEPPRSFSVVAGPNGHQVEYRGHPLYTSDQDTGPRQANGQGFDDNWYVVTPSLRAGASSGPSW